MDKSRDYHEHRDDVIEDLEGFRRHGIPLDAIVIDSPWETQYNTWEFNPHQFPDAPGMVARLRAEGVRTVLWITPWVNTDQLHQPYADTTISGQWDPMANAGRGAFVNQTGTGKALADANRSLQRGQIAPGPLSPAI